MHDLLSSLHTLVKALDGIQGCRIEQFSSTLWVLTLTRQGSSSDNS